MRTIKLLFFGLLICYADFLIAAGNPKLVALTSTGGIFNSGSILRYKGGNTSLDSHHDFLDSVTPYGSLIQASDGLMYGLAFGRGYDGGTLFQYDYDLDSIKGLVHFTGPLSHAEPYGSLLEAGDGKLYGIVNAYDSTNLFGGIFSYDIGSDSVHLLHPFPFGNFSYGSLIQAANGKLYGMTSADSFESGNGSIFEYNILTNAYSTLIRFPLNTDPWGSLLEVGSDTLYGVTRGNGSHNGGVLFRLIPNNISYSVLYNFRANANSSCTLIRATDGKLYGTLSDFPPVVITLPLPLPAGGLFSYDLNSGVYTDLYDCFDSSKGFCPVGSLFQASDSLLYGLTSWGGLGGNSNVYPFDSYGTIFQYNIFTNVYTKEVNLGQYSGGQAQFGNFIEYHPKIKTNISQVEEGKVLIYGKEGEIVIKQEQDIPIQITVTNIIGQQVVNAYSEDRLISIPLDASPAIYIVRVLSGKEIVKRVFVP